MADSTFTIRNQSSQFANRLTLFFNLYFGKGFRFDVKGCESEFWLRVENRSIRLNRKNVGRILGSLVTSSGVQGQGSVLTWRVLKGRRYLLLRIVDDIYSGFMVTGFGRVVGVGNNLKFSVRISLGRLSRALATVALVGGFGLLSIMVGQFSGMVASQGFGLLVVMVVLSTLFTATPLLMVEKARSRAQTLLQWAEDVATGVEEEFLKDE